MDANDIFKKLSFGVKFNKKKIKDTQKNIQPKTNDEKPHLSNNVIDIKNEVLGLETEGIENELTIVNGISHPGHKKKKRKKSKEKTEELKKQLIQEQLNEFRNKHRISVLGKSVATPAASFEEFQTKCGLSKHLVKNLKGCGYVEPTPIQMQAIPIMLQRRQILACAPTGSGKTAAFLVPIIHHLKAPKKDGFRAVIVSPTRELAKQTLRECTRLSEGTNLKIHFISKAAQSDNAKGTKKYKKYDILITTPNRLVYLLKQDPPPFSLNRVEWLIVDESDKLFETGPQGFRDQLAEIYRSCDSSTVKRAMFSATRTPEVARWAKGELKGLISVTVGHRNAASDLVDQELVYVGSEEGKLIAFQNIVRAGITPPVLVFVQTKERAKELFSELIYDGINVDVIHADRTQLQRDNVVRCFREGKIWVLICTELMGRGIDFKGVNLVINYDFPPSAISYVHRIGRTGRAGHRGKAITFFTQNDSVNLRSIAHVLEDSGCSVPEYMLKLKKPSRKEKKNLESKGLRRESISKPVYDDILKERKRKKIELYKQKKKKANSNLDENDKIER